MKYQLSKLEQIELRDVIQPDEEWLGTWLKEPKNLVQLSTVVGAKFAYGMVAESPAAPRSCIVLHDVATRQPVYIHPRVDRLNEAYLASLFHYLTQCETGVFLWVATHIDAKLKETVRWLNSITQDSVQFFAIGVNFWRIGQSVPAPVFYVECAPAEWHAPVRLALPTHASVPLTTQSTADVSSNLSSAVAVAQAQFSDTSLASPVSAPLNSDDVDAIAAENTSLAQTTQNSGESDPGQETRLPALPETPLGATVSKKMEDEVPLLSVRADLEDEKYSNTLPATEIDSSRDELSTSNEEPITMDGQDHALLEYAHDSTLSDPQRDTPEKYASWKQIDTEQNSLPEPQATPPSHLDDQNYQFESDRSANHRFDTHESPAKETTQQVKDPPRERRTSFLEGFLQRARGRPAQTEETPIPPSTLDALADPPALRAPGFNLEGRRWPQRQILPIPTKWPDDLDAQLEVITNFWKELNDLIAQRHGMLRPTLAFPQMWITFPTGHPDYVLAAELNPEAQVALVKLRLSGKTSADDFAILESHHQQIENQVGQSLLWQHNADERVICAERHGVDITNPRDWRSTQNWMADVLEQMYQLVTRWTS